LQFSLWFKRGFKPVCYALYNSGNEWRVIGTHSDGSLVYDGRITASDETKPTIAPYLDTDGETFTLAHAGPTLLLRPVEVPESEEPHEWLHKNSESFLPFSITMEDVHFDYRSQSADNGIRHTLTAVAKRSFVHALTEKFNTALGIRFRHIKAAPLEFLLSHLPPDLVGITAHIILDIQRTYIFILDHQDIRLYKDLPGGELLFKENQEQFLTEMNNVIVDFWELHLFGTPPLHYFIYGPGKELADHFASKNQDATLLLAEADISQEIAKVSAKASFQKGGNKTELADPPSDSLRKRILWKHIASFLSHTLLPGLVGLLLLILFFKGLLLLWQHHTEPNFSALQGKIHQLNRLKEENRSLRTELLQNNSLISRRSQTTLLLEKVRQVTPDGVWFSQMNFQEGKEGPDKLFLTGFSETDQELQRLFRNLESLASFKRVELLTSQSVSAGEAYRKTQTVSSKPVTFFKMEITK